MKSPTTNNERVRTPRKNKKQKGSVYQRTSKKERSSRKRKNSRKERRKQKRTKRKNKNRIYIKRRIEGGAPPASPTSPTSAASTASTKQDEQGLVSPTSAPQHGYLVVDVINSPQKYNIKEDLRKEMPEILRKNDNREYNLDNFTPLWQDLEVHIDDNNEYYYKIRSCNDSEVIKGYLGKCLKDISGELTSENKNTEWGKNDEGKEKIKLFNEDLNKIKDDNRYILGKIPEEFIFQLFKHIVCGSKHPDDGPGGDSEEDSDTSVRSESGKGSFAPYEMVSIDTNDLESLSNFSEKEVDTEGHEPTPWVALQERLLDAQTRLTLLGYIPTLGCLPKKDAYMLEYTVKQKVNKILELLDELTTNIQGPKFSPDVRRVLNGIKSKLKEFIKGGLEKEYRVEKVGEINGLVQQLDVNVREGENKKNIDIIIDKLEELGDDGTCRWQNKNGINDFITFLESIKGDETPRSPWSGTGEPDEEKALNEIKGIIRASREKYKEAVLEWGGGKANENDEVMATIYKRGYIEEHLLALMNKYIGDDNEGGTNGIFKGGIYQSTRSTISGTSGDSGDSYAKRVGIIEKLITNEKERVKTILTNTNSTIYYSTSDSGSSGFDTPRST